MARSESCPLSPRVRRADTDASPAENIRMGNLHCIPTIRLTWRPRLTRALKTIVIRRLAAFVKDERPALPYYPITPKNYSKPVSASFLSKELYCWGSSRMM